MKKTGRLLLIASLILVLSPALAFSGTSGHSEVRRFGRVDKVDVGNRNIYINGEKFFAGYGLNVLGPDGERHSWTGLATSTRVVFEATPPENKNGLPIITKMRILLE